LNFALGHDGALAVLVAQPLRGAGLRVEAAPQGLFGTLGAGEALLERVPISVEGVARFGRPVAGSGPTPSLSADLLALRQSYRARRQLSRAP